MTQKIEKARAKLAAEQERALIRALDRGWQLDAVGVDRMSDAGYRLFKYAYEQADAALEAFDAEHQMDEEEAA